MKKIEIYTTPTCAFCKMAKEFFAKNNIEYTEHNVAEDAEKRNELIQKSGQMGVPVIMIDGKMVIGFDEEKLRSSLGL